MAIYHLKVKPVSRADGRSSTAAAAYRAAELVHDETTGQTFDYTRKRGVEHAEIVLPTKCAKEDINWARDRQALWNEAEKAENRSNSRVAREYEIALPYELNSTQRLELARTFAQEIADRYGCGVDFAIHEPHREGDDRNFHAHLLATTRTIEPAGLGQKTEIEWSDGNRVKAGLVNGADEITLIRERWAGLANERLQELGLEVRIDHRTLEEQGIDREPTVHLGPAVSAMQRRGIETEVGKRLEQEALEAAQRRIEKAAELGQLEREAGVVEKSILDLSGDIENAKRVRDLELAKAAELGMKFGKRLTLEQQQQQAREQWLAYRAKATERTQEQVPEKALEKSQEPVRTLEEQQKDAREKWLEYRHGQGQTREREKGLEQSQDKSLEPSRQPTKGLDGPEFE